MNNICKKIIALFFVLIMIFELMPMDTHAESDRAIQPQGEYIYYSDLFYAYPYYLTNNLSLQQYDADTYEIMSNIVEEYITRPDFLFSVISEGITIATDPASVVKYVSDNMGLSSFQLNKELDKANEKLVIALCDVNARCLSVSKEIGR